MNARFRIYLGVLGALLLLYAVAEMYRPQPPNWRPTYQNNDKIAFGAYALVELLPGLFGTDDVTITRQPAFNQIADYSPQLTGAIMAKSAEAQTEVATEAQTETTAETVEVMEEEEEATVTITETPLDAAEAATAADPTAAGAAARPTYLFVSGELPLDTLDTYALLTFAARGHHVFIAAEALPARLLNRLGLVQRSYYEQLARNPDSVALRFAGDSTSRTYRFATAAVGGVLRLKSARPNPAVTALATDGGGRVVLARVRHGAGAFTVCTVPLAFTNYHVLRAGTADFAWRALSGLPRGPVWWDEYAKQGAAGSDSLLRVVFAYPALKLAFWLLLAGGVLLLWVGGRRRVRAIPIIKPLPNNTLQFVRTVAALYRPGADNHAIIAHHKIDLFLAFLRLRYREATDDLAAEPFRAALAQKTGRPRADINELLRRLHGIRTASYVSDGELLWLSEVLSEFRRR